jgi:hypothetical protein
MVALFAESVSTVFQPGNGRFNLQEFPAFTLGQSRADFAVARFVSHVSFVPEFVQAQNHQLLTERSVQRFPSSNQDRQHSRYKFYSLHLPTPIWSQYAFATNICQQF